MRNNHTSYCVISRNYNLKKKLKSFKSTFLLLRTCSSEKEILLRVLLLRPLITSFMKRASVSMEWSWGQQSSASLQVQLGVMILTRAPHTWHTYCHVSSHQDPEPGHFPLCSQVVRPSHMPENHCKHPKEQAEEPGIHIMIVMITTLSSQSLHNLAYLTLWRWALTTYKSHRGASLVDAV